MEAWQSKSFTEIHALDKEFLRQVERERIICENSAHAPTRYEINLKQQIQIIRSQNAIIKKNMNDNFEIEAKQHKEELKKERDLRNSYADKWHYAWKQNEKLKEQITELKKQKRELEEDVDKKCDMIMSLMNKKFSLEQENYDLRSQLKQQLGLE